MKFSGYLIPETKACSFSCGVETSTYTPNSLVGGLSSWNVADPDSIFIPLFVWSEGSLDQGHYYDVPAVN